MSHGEMIWEAYTGPLRRKTEGPAPRVDGGTISDIDLIQPDDEDGARAIPFIPSGEREARHDLSIPKGGVFNALRGIGRCSITRRSYH